jgi:hypothetical protein
MELAAVEQTEGQQRGWQGDTPVYLVIALEAGGVEIDLDEQGWATAFASYMRVPGLWVLFSKLTKMPLLMMNVHPDEQPYYTARHFGSTGAVGEVIAYGIGKKRTDGHVDRMWLLPNGVVCPGDDVDPIAMRMLRSRG